MILRNVAGQSASLPLPRTRRMAITRRRRISVRIAIRCSVKNSTVKPSAITSSGHSRLGSMVGPPSRNTEAGWCSVFHQSTENLMIGMLMKPTSVMIGGGARRRGRIVERAGQRDDAEIHQEQHEDRGQPRVPHPPGAPHRLAPDRAGDQRQRGEDGADRRGGLQRDVGQRMAPDQRAERRRAPSASSTSWRARRKARGCT